MSNKSRETFADIVAEMRRDCPARHMDGTRYRDGDWVYTKGTVEKLADRIEAAAKRGDDVWRAAFAKVTSVVSRQHAKRNLGEHGSRAVDEIMSACRFADGALDEYERAFAENARLRAALKPVLECKVMSALAVGGIVEAGRKSERGNSAAMREALEKLKEAYFENDDGFARIDCSIVPDFEGLIDAALAAPARNCDLYATLVERGKPLRNCDVGTREEANEAQRGHDR